MRHFGGEILHDAFVRGRVRGAAMGHDDCDRRGVGGVWKALR